MEIGLMIKELRLKKQLTQEELADRCELTKGYISQLENDLTSPSIATLADILNALGTTMSDFFDLVEEEKNVFTAGEHFEKATEESSVTWLVPNSQKNMMEPILFSLAAGAESEKDMPHEGEEFGFVIAGKIMVSVGGKESRASAGDSFYLRSGKTHFIKNIGTSRAKIIWVSCPPNF